MASFAEQVAAELLRSDGLAAIWKLHLLAGMVHLDGYSREADRLLRIADAAEEVVRRDVPDHNEFMRGAPRAGQ
jgi:hypothetical protein